jgi:hypothetical protein
MIKRLTFRNRKNAVLRLNPSAAPKDLSRRFKLHTRGNTDREAMQALEARLGQKKAKKSNVRVPKKIKRTHHATLLTDTVRQIYRTLIIIAVGLLGIGGTLYNLAEGYHYSGDMFYVQATVICVLTFAINIAVALWDEKQQKDAIIVNYILAWCVLAVQCFLHLRDMALLWFEPGDDEVYFAEFWEEGIAPMLIAVVICLLLHLAANSFKKK